MRRTGSRRLHILGLSGVAGVTAALALAPLGSTAVAAPTTVLKVGTEAQLRAAVDAANAHPGKYRVQLRADIVLADASAGDLDLTASLDVQGQGRTLDAAGLDRIFDVAAGGSLDLNNITLIGGVPATGESGGAIRSAGSVRINNAVLSGNHVSGTGASGGAITNLGGDLLVNDSALVGNSASRAGGAIEANAGTTVVRSSSLRGNSTGAMPGNGGGFHLTGAGTVTVTGSEVIGNTAAAEGGGLWNSSTGTFAVVDSVIRDNVASGAGADQGGGGLFNDGDTTSGGTMTVRGSRIEGNLANGTSGSGGGILNDEGSLIVTASVVNDNVSRRAGGGLEANVGDTDLGDVSMSGNRTGANPGNGGALHLSGAGQVRWNGGIVTGNDAGKEGGGVWNSAPGTMVLTNLDVFGNTAVVVGNEGTGTDLFWQLPATGVFLFNGSTVAAG